MAKTNEELVRELIRGGYLKTPLLIDTFRAIDRKDFVPPDLRGESYGNYPLPIGYGQTISQPLTVAFMLELLDPKPGEKILDIGTGSGWVAALLSYVVSQKSRNQSVKSVKIKNQNTGMVISIERIRKLSEFAEQNLKKYGFVERGVLKLIVGDGSLGYEAEAPYDKIIAAAAGEKIPEVWKKQLKAGGRIVAPIAQSIIVLDKVSETEFREEEYFGFSFVPLVRD